MRILVVAAHYPPENSVAASRPAAWVRELLARGHEVSVLTTTKRVDATAAWAGAPDGAELIELAMPGSGLVRAADRRSAQSGAGRVGLHPLAALLDWLRRSRGVLCSARMPDHHDLWALRALRALRGRSWDVVISTHGPYACHFIGWRLRCSGGAARWIADFRDLWSDNHIFPGLPPFSFLERRLERLLCRRADELSTVSEPLAEVLRHRHQGHVQVIENTIDLGSFANLDAAPAFPRDGLVRIVYTGTIYRSGQSPLALLVAMERLRDEAPTVFARLRLVFAGKFQHGVRELAVARGLASSIEFCGQVPRETALRMQRDADALLFLSFDSRAYGGILTAKLFEYLASGTEILSTGYRRDAETALMIETSGRGRDYGADAGALLEALVRIATTEQPKFVDLATARRIDRTESAARLFRIVESCRDPGGAN